MKIIFGLALLTLVVANPPSKFNNPHKYMTDEELKSVFQTDRHNVPEYHVTPKYYPKLHKRSADSLTRLRLNVFGRDIDLSLNPTDGILAGFDTPVYVARRNVDGENIFEKINNSMAVVSKMLEDREKKATVIVKKNGDDKYTVSGTIESEGANLKPLSDRFNEHYNRVKKSAEEPEYLKNATLGEYSQPFVFYKKPKMSDDAKHIVLNVKKNISKIRGSRSKRSVPTIIYPQILVLADYRNFQIHGEDVDSIVEYMLAYWNSVDLRFRLLEAPKVRLNIAGIVIATDPNVFSFFTANNFIAHTINSASALHSLSEYMYQVESTFPFDSYDIAVAMTPYDICNLKEEKCLPTVLGSTYYGGACDVLHAPDNRTGSVAILKDRGAFYGISVAAHEIGHLMGGRHDGENGNDCQHNEGHIMTSDKQYKLHSAHWSNCSLEEFAKFLRKNNPICLYDKPKTTTPIPRVLPGRLLSMDEQCMRLVGTQSCMVKGEGCMQLNCVWQENHEYCAGPITAAADGIICDTGKICLYGQCLSEAETIESFT